jgi:predicted chitinase
MFRETLPPVDKPERLIENSFNSIDAGCWYTTIFRNSTVAAMDLYNVTKVTTAINGGENVLKARTKFTSRLRKVLL